MAPQPYSLADNFVRMAERGWMGKILVLDAYFDATIAKHHSPQIFGVAGILFTPENAKRFETAWAPRIAGLNKPFRTAACVAGRAPFLDWSRDDREALLRDLAKLMAETRDAGFAATISLDDYKSFAAERPNQVALSGTPYTLCMMACIDSVCGYLNKNYPGETVAYWIEAGTEGEKELADFLRRIYENEKTRERFKVRTRTIAPKTDALALCAADFLAWEWQRNFVEAERNEADGWRDNFKLLFKDQQSKPIHPIHLNQTRMSIRAMIHGFYEIYED